jgi:organic radical activating enzyme
MRQDIRALVAELLGRGLRVQIETAGTLWIDIPEDPRLHIVCSPKTSRLHPRLESRITHYKYVIAEGDSCPEDGLPQFSTQRQGVRERIARPRANVPVYVMPRDDGDDAKNSRNTQACLQVALEHGHSMALQVHKALGIR